MTNYTLRLLWQTLAAVACTEKLTLSTLNTGGTSLLVVVHVLVTVGGLVLLPVVWLLKGDFVHVDLLWELLNGLASREGLFKVGDEGRLDRSGENDVDADVEISELVVAVRRHTLVRDDLHRSRLDDFSRNNGDVQSALIEVLNGELSTAKGGQEVDLGLAEEVITLALEPGVLLLLDNNDDISRLNSRSLIALSLETNLLTRLHSFVNVDLEHLALRDRLLAVALLALVLGVDDLSSGVAVVARLLDLLHHGTKLTEHDLDTLTAASGTRCD